MAVAPNTGMKKADMRKLLSRSKEEPVTCAVGQSDATGLLLLDKRKPGRALETALKAEFPDAKNTRFGTAFVDVDDNPKLVKLTLNKPVTGMAKRLIKTLKGTGFNKVIILMEDGSLMEQFEEEDLEPPIDGGDDAPAPAPAVAAAPGAPPPPPAAPPPPPSASDAAAQAATLIAKLKELSARIPAAADGVAARVEELSKIARKAGVEIKTNNLVYAANTIAQLERALDTAPPPPPPPPPAPPPPPPSPADRAQTVAALSAQLKELVPQVASSAGTDAVRLAALSKLAKDAGIAIKTNNLNDAAKTIEQLRTALAAPAAAPGTAAPGTATPESIAASRVTWTTMRQQIAADVDRLGAALAQTYAGQELAGEIERRFRAKVAPVLARFDDKLGDALDALAEAGPDQRDGLTASARAQVAAYRSFAEGDALIADLDGNPFVTLDIRGRATAALGRVEQALG